MSYNESKERKLRMEKLRHNSGPVWFNPHKNRLEQFSWHDYNRYLKKHCRRQTRRALNRKDQEFIDQGRSTYKKEYDYWNELI